MTPPAFTAYDRRSLVPTVVHLGPGVFHRAHQAVYADAVLRTGARSGAVWGVSLRSPQTRDALQRNDFAYHVVERRSGVPDVVRPVGALLGIDVASEGVERVLARLADPSVTVVTVTVTEHGYCATSPGGSLDPRRPEVLHDLEHPQQPKSLPGLLLEGLVRRRAAGIAPFTVVSCDNLPGNGKATARVVLDLAEYREPRLSSWLRGNVAFPSSMVDRMVPATTDEDRHSLLQAGVDDGWPVVAEPFSQWVLEDLFPFGRPRWERAGVELVSDVSRHEQAKLRILNAAHSALAYWGLLAGYRFVWQAANDRVLLAATRDLLQTEVIPTLATPPGWDLHAYAEQALRRFCDPALPYSTVKVATDGSQKLPVRLIPTLRARLLEGAPAPRCAQLLAAWAACMCGPRAGTFAVADPALGAALGGSSGVAALPGTQTTVPGGAVRRLLSLPGFLDPAVPREAAFVRGMELAARDLWHGNVRTALAFPFPVHPHAARLGEVGFTQVLR
ncbi:MAG TPA: mannitol dehydrogenase family protein [Kineosporiaceae bacterium]|nr:mannitol dehydrogenase family protein [Kineosporiaceae bacterium]